MNPPGPSPPSLPLPFPGAPRPNPLAMPPKDPLDRLRVESPREAKIDYAVVAGLFALPFLIQYAVPGGGMLMWRFTAYMGTVPLFGSLAAIWMVTRRAARVAACAAPGFREEVRLAGLAPSACLEARLDPVRRRLLVLLLLMALPRLCINLWWLADIMERSGPPGSAPSMTAYYLGDMLARYVVGLGMLIVIARSAFDEMAIHAVSPGSTAGTIAARGAATLILRQIPAWAAGWVVTVSLPMFLMVVSGGDAGPYGATSAAASLIGTGALVGFGLVLLLPVFLRIRTRRRFARERMDALD